MVSCPHSLFGFSVGFLSPRSKAWLLGSVTFGAARPNHSFYPRAAELGAVKYLTYPGQGHALHGESWDLFMQRVSDFYDQYVQS